MLPSGLASGIFVYGFIAATFYISLSSWSTARVDLNLRPDALGTYVDLIGNGRFQADLRNTVVFTVLFLAVTTTFGLSLAIALDIALRGRLRGLFRHVFLFPYALSFIVTGVIWRWIFNPETGINLLFDATGLNALLARFGMAPLHPGWLTDPTVVLSVNDALGAVFPQAHGISAVIGIPLAIIPVVIASAWQLTGFAMAMYVAGLGTISPELREAARIDGASELQVYRRVVMPILKPITVSIVIILGATSLKIFDLIVGLSGRGPGFATDVPGLFVYDTAFGAQKYNVAAAASIVMLVIIAIVVVPYLARNLRQSGS